MSAIQDLIKNLDEQMKHPLPTPHVSCMVLWYPRGDVREDNAVAAMVTAKESPGKVTLTVFKPNSMQEHKKGVHFVGHPAVAEKTHSQARIHNGVWDYPENSTPRKSHYDMHLDELKRKKDAALSEKTRQLEAAANKSNLERSLSGTGEPDPA